MAKYIDLLNQIRQGEGKTILEQGLAVWREVHFPQVAGQVGAAAQAAGAAAEPSLAAGREASVAAAGWWGGCSGPSCWSASSPPSSPRRLCQPGIGDRRGCLGPPSPLVSLHCLISPPHQPSPYLRPDYSKQLENV